MPCRHIALVVSIAVLAAAKDTAVVIEGTLETSLGQPMVHVQLADGRRVLTGRATELEILLGEEYEIVRSFPAFLDTGASSLVISASTAERFGIEATPKAVYHEVGLHDEVAMAVSRPYRLALAGHDGRRGADVEFTTIQREARLLLNRSAEAPIWQQLAAGIDVIGMPAIESLVVEIVPVALNARARGARGRPGAGDPLGQLEALQELLQPPVVRLHDRQPRISSRDLVVELEYMDFNRRRHPRNAGPLPALAANPVITGIAIDHGDRSVTGDWLLDTGAASSLISTAHAQKLGLLGETGKPVRAPDFSLTVTGIGGTPETHPGFVLDRLRVRASRDRTLEYRRVHVIVRDVSVQLDTGPKVVLDGVFGMNLLLPTATGLSKGVPDNVAEAPFKRIWIDGRKRRLILERK